MSVMAALAGRTRRLKFGMNVVSLALRDPVLLAKQCATIDVLSEGRLLPAFGIGIPARSRMGGAAHRHQDAGHEDRRGARDHRPAVARGQRRLRRRALQADRRHHRAQAGAGRPADLDRRRLGGGGQAHGATRHRLARRARDAGGGRPDRGRPSSRGARRPGARSTTTTTARAFLSISAARRTRPCSGACRPTRSAPGAIPRATSPSAMPRRLSARMAEYIDAGVSKFVLRPVGAGEEAVLAQTRRLIEEVLPLAAAVGQSLPSKRHGSSRPLLPCARDPTILRRRSVQRDGSR